MTWFPPRLRQLGVSAVIGCSLLACAAGEVDDNDSGFAETSGATDDASPETGESPTGESPTGDGDADLPDDTGDTCTALGCDCAGTLGSCADGLACVAGTCVTPICGNSEVERPVEDCDDGNDFEGDGCDNDCSYTEILAIEAGAYHTCALIEGGRVRCWGLNHVGQLGYGNTDNVGDNEPPSSSGDVVLGEPALALSVGAYHACALLAGGTARCWGYNGSGQLGLGNNTSIGDDEFPFSVAPLVINAEPLALTTGSGHTCARVGAGSVRCWGDASAGQLGYGNTTPLAIPLTLDLDLGAPVVGLATGDDHNCALLDDGDVRCWGRNDRGQLGYGNTDNIGDTEVPGAVVPVPILPQGIAEGTPVAELALGGSHTCARYETGDVLCWGDNFYGQLGQGTTTTVGDNETLATLFPVDLGADATALALGRFHTCALLDTGEVKCWGRNLYGQLGQGDVAHIGDDETPASVPAVEVGGEVTAVAAGIHHTCAVVDGHDVLCWGYNDFGQLGYADTESRGDDELPVDVGGIELF